MTKEHLESILTEYGVAFTDSLADRLLKEFKPCEDAISRQAVLDAIDVKAWEFCDYLISKNRNDEQKPVSHFADTLRECVREELPSVNPQPKTGHWIRVTDKSGHLVWECGKCSWQQRYNTNFCPDCGVKMVEPQERSE